MLLNVITATAFLFIALGIFLVMRMLFRRDNAMVHRLGIPAPAADGPVFGGLTESMAAQLPNRESNFSTLEKTLRQAGYYGRHARGNFQAVRNFLTIAVVLMTAYLIFLTGPEHISLCVWIGVGGAALALLAFVIPAMILRAKAKRRIDRIERGLPDALDVITMCLAGGLTLRAALEHVTAEIKNAHPELAQEFAIVLQQGEMGTLPMAFRQFGERTDSSEVRALASVVQDTQRLGVDMQTAVIEQADSIRRSYRQRADERANRTGVKLIMPFVFCLLPAVAIFLWAPALLQLREFLAKETRPGGAFSQNMSVQIRDAQRDFRTREFSNGGGLNLPANR